MGAGVDGARMVPAVDLVAEELNTSTDRVTLHPHNSEETHALDHHRNLPPATQIVALVIRYKDPTLCSLIILNSYTNCI